MTERVKTLMLFSFCCFSVLLRLSMQEKRPAIKEQYPDVEHGNEHTKKLAAMWKAMGKEEKDVSGRWK